MVLADRTTLDQMVHRKWLNIGDPGMEAVDLDDWHDLPEVMGSRFKGGDLPVLFMARRGRLSWQPVQDRFPGMLGRALSDGSILEVFPPEMKWEVEERSGGLDASFEEIFPSRMVHLNMPRITLAEAMEFMLTSSLGDPSAELAGDLYQQLRDFALKLAPGCVLVHTHKAQQKAPKALVGAAAEEFCDSDIEGSAGVEILIILLGTPDQSPEDHLRRLARIARLFHDKQLLKRIRSANTYDDILSKQTPGSGQG